MAPGENSGTHALSGEVSRLNGDGDGIKDILLPVPVHLRGVNSLIGQQVVKDLPGNGALIYY